MMILFCFDILTLQIKIYYHKKCLKIFKYYMLQKRVKRTPAPVI